MGSGPSDTLDIPRSRKHFANTIVPEIRYKDIPRPIDVYAGRTVERSAGSWATVAAKIKGPISGYRLNISSSGDHLSDSAVVSISNENVPRTVHEHNPRTIKFRAGGGPAVAA